MTPEERYQRITGMNPNSERFLANRQLNTVSKLRRMLGSKQYGAVTGEDARRLMKSRVRDWSED